MSVGATRAGTLLERSLARSKYDIRKLRADARFRADVVGVYRGFVALNRSAVEDLAAATTRMALASIGEELKLCERTPGSVLLVMDRAAPTAKVAAAESLAVFGRTELYAEEWLGRAVTDQLGFAVMYDDDLAQLRARLFSKEPARLSGNGGVGVWLQTAGILRQGARGLAIGLANTVRTGAMKEFNR